mgnify:CR=1 FL=1
MRILILTLPIFFAACDRPVEYVTVKPTVAPDLLEPCAISERVAVTYRDLAVLATEHLGAARCANGKILAISEIIKD